MQLATSETSSPRAVVPIPARRGRRAQARRFFAPLRDGPYRVPEMLAQRLEAALASAGNAEAACRLLVWLLCCNRGRRVVFPVDRAAIAGRASLGLTESQVRTALAKLVQAGALERLVEVGQGGFKRDGTGRRPILFRFGALVSECFAVKAPGRRRVQKFKSPKGRPSVVLEGFRRFGAGSSRASVTMPGAARRTAEAEAAAEALAALAARPVALPRLSEAAIGKPGRSFARGFR